MPKLVSRTKIKKRDLIAFVCMFVIAAGIFVFSTRAAGESYFVDKNSPSCSDSYTTSQNNIAAPWCSIQKAVSSAPGGSTVNIRSGTYDRPDISSNNIRASIVTFKPYQSELVTLNGLKITASSYLRFEGFTLNGSVIFGSQGSGNNYVEFANNEINGFNMTLDDNTNVKIENNHIHDVPSTAAFKGGIKVLRDDYLEIRGNTIENLFEDPIQLDGTNFVTIENNILKNVYPGDTGAHSDAIQFIDADDITVKRNFITSIQHGLMFTNGQSSNVTIENNVVTNVSTQSIKADGTVGVPGLKVLNNTFTGNGGQVDFRDYVHPGAVIRNNIFDSVNSLGIQTSQSNNFIGTPQFVNAASGDYRLPDGSPLIDAGSSEGTPQQDKNGSSRVDITTVPNTGSGSIPYYDIGAFEYSSSATNQPLRGDINSDKIVDFVDLSILLTNYGKTTGQLSDPDADVNGSGLVDIFDLSILLSNYGKASTSTSTNQALGFNTLNSAASDDFNGATGTKPASSKWGAKTFTASNGSVVYWNGLNNVQLDGSGNLDIFATRQASGSWNSSWISGTQSYSGPRYIEARAKVPSGQGTWAAPIWEWDYPWGSNGPENDVIEQLGFEPTAYHTTLHSGGTDFGKKNVTSTTLANDYHVYGAAIYADRVDYYFDGAKIQTITKTEMGNKWGFDTTPMVLNINLDMGGWGGTPSASLPSTVHMLVDYIRVYTP